MSLFVHTGQGPSPSAWAREGAILQMLPRGLCFNEAQAFQPGKPGRLLLVVCDQLLASMRPKPFSLGNLSSASAQSAMSARFNEAQAFQPGKLHLSRKDRILQTGLQ